MTEFSDAFLSLVDLSEGVPAYKHPYGWIEYIRNIIILIWSHTNCLQLYKPNVWNNRKGDYLIDTTNFSLSADKIIIFYILETSL